MASRLKKGDRVGIAAVSSPFDQALFQQGIAVLKKMGWEVYHRPDIFAQEHYLAGSDSRRLEELTELITNPKIKAIFFARGGYGVQRILPRLDLKRIKKHPKPLIGFSDLTPLLAWLNQAAGFPTLYGPVVTQLGNHPSARTLETLQNYLTQTTPPPPLDLSGAVVLKEGDATGTLTGGCLSLVNTSLGTPYAFSFKNKIVFLEDANEKLYALDRMLTQLINAGCLHQARGLLIGTLQTIEKDEAAMLAMLRERLSDFDGPVVANLPFGHTPDFVSLPFGVNVTLDTQSKQLTVHEPWLK